MADEDEFEFDDIDEDTLNAIAEIESKAITATQVKAESSVPPASGLNNPAGFRGAASFARPGPPPPKRPRTEAWKPQPTSKAGFNPAGDRPAATATNKAVQPSKPTSTRAKSTFEDFDFVPDISITLDGTYTVTATGSKVPNTTPSHAVPARQPDPTPPNSTINPKAANTGLKPITGSTFQRPPSRANSPATFAGPAPPSTHAPNRSNLAPPQQPNRQRSTSPVPGPLGSQTNNFQNSTARTKPPGPLFKPSIQRAGHSYQAQPSQLESTYVAAGDSAPRAPFSALGSQDVKQRSFREQSLARAAAAPSADDTDLQKQLEQLRLETEALKASLQKAQEEKMMKEGEASNMKRALEKQNQQHASDVARVKAERDAKVSVEIEAQNALKAQIEALKAKLNFQKIESEASSGKWSTRKPNQLVGAGSQVGQTPSRRVNALAFTADAWAATPSRRTSVTPARSFGGGFGVSQMPKSAGRTSSPLKGILGSATKGKAVKREGQKPVAEEPSFSMFHNSFAKGGSPVKKRSEKGKTKDVVMSSPTKSSPVKAMVIDDDDGSPRKSQHFTLSLPNADLDTDQDDLDQADVEQFPGLLPSEPPLEPWRIDWRDEMHSVIFSHAHHDFIARPYKDADLTIQILVSTQIEEGESAKYRKACGLILSAFTLHPRKEEWPDVSRDVSEGLVICVDILTRLKSLSTLIPVLKLIEALIITIPPFASDLLTAQTLANDAPHVSLFAASLVAIIAQHLAPPPVDLNDKDKSKDPPPPWDRLKTRLGEAVLDVLDALIWQVEPECTLRMTALVSKPECLLYLINSGQPPWVVKRGLRLLVMFIIHKPLIKFVLGLYGPNGEPVPQYDLARVLLIQRLCGYLILPHRWASHVEINGMAGSIFTFFATLTEVHDEGTSLLVESIWVIPSLIVFLAHNSARLFEEDESIVNGSEEDQLLAVRSLFRACHLLWHTVRPGRDDAVDLRRQILQAAARDPLQFNGLHHLFILAFGRLSYADPPDFLKSELKDTTTKMGEFARDLLESVVEGPELDNIWEAYQQSDETDDGTADEEEMARQMSMDVEHDG
ncbi:hypothetical protein FRC05_004389 [Tulasnella sp. 425]|nr:hypothetical protein FRC05_004389 [Tulasnella sp. 425]